MKAHKLILTPFIICGFLCVFCTRKEVTHNKEKVYLRTYNHKNRKDTLYIFEDTISYNPITICYRARYSNEQKYHSPYFRQIKDSTVFDLYLVENDTLFCKFLDFKVNKVDSCYEEFDSENKLFKKNPLLFQQLVNCYKGKDFTNVMGEKIEYYKFYSGKESSDGRSFIHYSHKYGFIKIVNKFIASYDTLTLIGYRNKHNN